MVFSKTEISWILINSLNQRYGFIRTLHKINPEGSCFHRSASFLFYSSTKTNPTVSSYLALFANEVCSEVPEDSRVLRVRRWWFPTSDHLQNWCIPSGTTRSIQYHVLTISWRNLPPYDRFEYFVLSFSSKRASQSGSKNYQRWYEGRLRQTMLDSWYCLDRIVPEKMSQVSRRSEVRNLKLCIVLKWALLSNGYFLNVLTLCL